MAKLYSLKNSQVMAVLLIFKKIKGRTDTQTQRQTCKFIFLIRFQDKP